MDWRTALISDGFAIFPQLIAPPLVERARDAIDEALRPLLDTEPKRERASR